MIGIHTASGQPRRRASVPGLRLAPLARPPAPAPPDDGMVDDDCGGAPASSRLSALAKRTPSPPEPGDWGGTRPPNYTRRYHRLHARSTRSAGADDKGDRAGGWISRLNYDILSCIAGHMDAKTLLALAGAQRRFAPLREDSLVWYSIYSREFSVTANVANPEALRTVDWSAKFRARYTTYRARRFLADGGALGGEQSDLRRGKYTSWSFGNGVAMNALPACLYAIGEAGVGYPLTEDGPNLHPHQVAALGFLRSVFDAASRPPSRRDSAAGDPLPELTTEEWNTELAASLGCTASALDFETRTAWARDLTASDIFGILWHIGGFAVRGWAVGRAASAGRAAELRSRSATPEGADIGALGLDMAAVSGSEPATVPTIQQINPRQLMCILHLMKLGAAEPTYYQCGGVRNPMPERLYGHMDAAAFGDMEEEAAALRSKDTTSPYAPPSCPRPSSGGITDSFGRPFEPLWGDDDDETAAEPSDESSVPLPSPMSQEPEPEPEPEAASAPDPQDDAAVGMSHLSIDAPEADDTFDEPPPPPRSMRGRTRMNELSESTEEVRESYHFDHFTRESFDDGLAAAGGILAARDEEEEETEEQWSLDPPPTGKMGRNPAPETAAEEVAEQEEALDQEEA